MSDLSLISASLSFPVFEAELVMPIRGAWTASVQIDAEAELSGRVTLSYKGATWSCSIIASGIYGGRCLVRLVGGAGGLGTPLEAKHYRDVTVRAVLDDVFRASGEKLSPTVLDAVIDQKLPTWTRASGNASSAIGDIAEKLGLSWRVLRDGTVWIGSETWPEVTGQFVITREEPQFSRMVVAPETAFLIPGSTFRTRRVSEVAYNVGASGFRAHLLFESDGIAAVLRRLVRSFTRDDRFRAAYFGSVVTQHDDGTLDVKLETSLVPSPCFVPIRYGLPGISAKVKPGARVAVTYEDGDSRRPVATVWDVASVEELHITAEKIVTHSSKVELGEGGRAIARHGDLVRITAATTPFQTVEIELAGLGRVTVTGWYINGIPTRTLAGQVSAFSSNKAN
ncbi:MAG: hypothetical protein U0165_03545 [Polyangiaceae bacterium]